MHLPFLFQSSTLLALIGLGILWTYRSCSFLNISLGALIVIGGFLFDAFYAGDLFSAFIALSVTLTLCGAVNLVFHFGLFNRLRRSRATSSTLLLSSFGLYIVLENVLALITGSKTIAPSLTLAWPFSNGNSLGLTNLEWLFSIGTLGSLLVLEIMLFYSTWGMALRAVSENFELAAVSGVNSRRVQSTAAFGSGVAAGLVGIFSTLNTGITASDGMNLIISGAVAAILGGLGSISGLLFSAMVIATLQQATVYYLGAQWRDLFTFGALFLVLYAFRHRLFGGGVYSW